MKRILVPIVMLQLLLGQAIAGASWTSTGRKIKSVQVGMDYVQILTTDNIVYIYRSTSANCSPDGLKAVLSLALTAKTTDDAVYFKVFDDTQTSTFEFYQARVGG